MRQYYGTLVIYHEATQGEEHRLEVEVPADVYARADFANSDFIALWQAAGEPLTFHVSPFGGNEDHPIDHNRIFYIAIRMLSRAGAFAPLLQTMEGFGINVLHCVSVDMGSTEGTGRDISAGEPAELLVLIPPTLLVEIQATIACVGRVATNKKQSAYITACAEIGHQDLRIRARVTAQLSELQPDPALEAGGRDVGDHSITDRRFWKIFSRRDLTTLSVSNVLEDLFLAYIAADSATLLSIEAGQDDFLSALRVEVPSALASAPLSQLHAKQRLVPGKVFARRPDGCYSAIIPYIGKQRPHYATVTFDMESHLLSVSFKSEQEVILSLRGLFRHAPGELNKLVQALSRLNVNLRVIRPLPPGVSDRVSELEELVNPLDTQISDGGVVAYQMVGNIQSSPLRILGRRTIPEVIHAEMEAFGRGQPHPRITHVDIPRGMQPERLIEFTISELGDASLDPPVGAPTTMCTIGPDGFAHMMCLVGRTGKPQAITCSVRGFGHAAEALGSLISTAKRVIGSTTDVSTLRATLVCEYSRRLYQDAMVCDVRKIVDTLKQGLGRSTYANEVKQAREALGSLKLSYRPLLQDGTADAVDRASAALQDADGQPRATVVTQVGNVVDSLSRAFGFVESSPVREQGRKALLPGASE